MTVYPLDVDLRAVETAPLQMFFLQWHTPISVEAHTVKKIDPAIAEERRSLLQRFRDWLLPQLAHCTPGSPVFIIAPELSVPHNCWAILDEISQQIGRPAVIIAGLEYQTWDEYQTLVGTIFAVPNRDKWLEGGDQNHSVNAAAIWIRDNTGTVHKYIQAKIHPYYAEEAFVYKGQASLLFRSRIQMSGERLNFCFQVCSDFANPDFVRELRREVARHCTPLDVTFLLQSNSDQEADQFKHAARAYFEVPLQMTDTDQSALIFVNNANSNGGDATAWGGSRFHFRFAHRWSIPSMMPTATYWFDDDGPNDHQRVVFRECGPVIHWVRYRLAYLVSRIAGSGQALPFEASSSLINGSSFHYAGEDCKFVRITAVPHWFQSQCRDHEAEFETFFDANNVHNTVRPHFLTEYRTATTHWMTALGNLDKSGQDAVNIYFECWPETAGYPHKEVEPRKWRPDVGRATRLLIDTYVNLQIGASALPGNTIKPDFQGVRHASTGEAGITFIWGDSQRSVGSMIQSYKKARDQRGLADRASRHTVLVLINPSGHLVPTTNEESDITEAEPVETDNIARAAPPKLTLLSNAAINGLLGEANTPEAHRTLVEEQLRVAFQ